MRGILTILFFLILIVIKGCTKVEVYNPNIYNINSPYFLSIPSLESTFVVCSEVFASKVDIDYQAGLICSTIKKDIKFVKRTYFRSCYFLQPVVNVYECV